MTRMRCAARTIILVTIISAALTASASVSLVLIAGMEAFLIDAGKVLGFTFAVVMGLFALAKGYSAFFVDPLFKALEARQDKLIADGLVKLKESFDALIEHHVKANDPHPVASDRMHEPLYDADQMILAELHSLKERLNKLIKAHNGTMRAEAWCARAAHRHTDPPESDFRSGLPTLGTIVDDEEEDPE